jgi:hypothetical protein
MSKKRRLSPTASSRSSATPAPVQIAVLDGSPLKSALDPGSSPVAEPALGVPGPSRLSASLTPAPAVAVERALARHGVSVLGSGDGSGPGDECFLWDGLPMNKQGGSTCCGFFLRPGICRRVTARGIVSADGSISIHPFHPDRAAVRGLRALGENAARMGFQVSDYSELSSISQLASSSG